MSILHRRRAIKRRYLNREANGRASVPHCYQRASLRELERTPAAAPVEMPAAGGAEPAAPVAAPVRRKRKAKAKAKRAKRA